MFIWTIVNYVHLSCDEFKVEFISYLLLHQTKVIIVILPYTAIVQK